MTVKNFDFAARRAAQKPKAGGGKAKKDVPFKLEADGPTYHVRAEISEDTLALVSLSFKRAERETDLDEMSDALYDSLDNVFPKETRQALLRRVRNPDDPGFGFEQLGEVIEWAVEQHSGGRPTTSSRT